MSMEIKVNNYELPAVIDFNYEEIKTELQSKMDEYATCVYTDDTVKEAKKDRAELNNLKKSINARRLELEREYNKPFAEFKAKVNELIDIIDEPIKIIDTRVKEYEAEQKEKRRAEIAEHIANTTENPELFELAWDDAWLNASTTMKKVREKIAELDAQFTRELNILKDVSEYSFEAIEKYKQTLSLTEAIEETKRLTAQTLKKAEFEAQREAEKEVVPSEPEEEETVEGFLPFGESYVEPTLEVNLRFFVSPSAKNRLFDLLHKNRFVFSEVEE